MQALGFKDITNPIMLKTVGKVMTLKKGAQMKGIDLDVIKKTFMQYNFQLEDIDE